MVSRVSVFLCSSATSAESITTLSDYMVKRVVDLVDFGVDGITPYTKGDSCFQIDALRLAIQFGPEADFDGPEFKEFSKHYG